MKVFKVEYLCASPEVIAVKLYIFNEYQMDSTDQYLRINNSEIVGLDNPGENETVENLILECLNGLNPENEVVSADIDICHALLRNLLKNTMIRKPTLFVSLVENPKVTF